MVDELSSMPDTATNNTIEEQVARGGLQTGLIEKFIKLSAAGKRLLEEIAQYQEKQEKDKQQSIQEHMNIIKKEANFIIAILKEAEEQEQKQGKQQVEQQTIDSAAQKLAKTPPPAETKNADEKATTILSSELNETVKEIERKEKQYKEYNTELNEADTFINDLPQGKEQLIATLDEEIKNLAKGQEEQLEKVHHLLGEGKDQEARVLMDTINTRTARIGVLEDRLAVAKGDKKMYNSSGEPVTSFKDAAFIVPSQRNLVKEGNEFYLYDKAVPDDNKEKAKNRFDRNRAEMITVRDLVQSNQNIEMTDLDKKIERIQREIEALPQVQSLRSRNNEGSVAPQMSAVKDNDGEEAPCNLRPL